MTNQEYLAAYQALPAEFQFKHAKATLAKQDSATSNFLRQCLGAGIVRKDGNIYRKTIQNQAGQEHGLAQALPAGVSEV